MPTSDYELGDGTPRYGVRSTGTNPPPPSGTPGDSPQRIAEHAARLDAVQLRTAADYRFTLDRFGADATLIEALRACNPAELKVAEELVRTRLASPQEWLDGAARIYAAGLVTSGTAAAVSPVARFAAAAGSLALVFLPFVAWLAVKETAPGDFWAIAAFLLALAVAVPLRMRLKWTVRGALPTRLGAADRETLWNDVVNATLTALVLSCGKEVDSATARAARRGWNHTVFAAARVKELEANHGDLP